MVATGLLEELAERVGCLYLSDLHDSRYLPQVRLSIRRMRPEDYTPEQWNEAVRYLLGHEARFSTAREAWAYLCGRRP